MIVTPLILLGGSFYSIWMLPRCGRRSHYSTRWLYLVGAFRWSFYGVADVNVAVSVAMILGFMALLGRGVVAFKTGYKLRA